MPQVVMHQILVLTIHLGSRAGDSWAYERDNFLIIRSPQCGGFDMVKTFVLNS